MQPRKQVITDFDAPLDADDMPTENVKYVVHRVESAAGNYVAVKNNSKTCHAPAPGRIRLDWS